MPTPNGDQFRKLYHSSYSSTPPHLASRDTLPTDDSGNTVSNVYAGYHPDALFVGGRGAAENILLDDRDFLHTYEVPESAIDPVMYADDHWDHLDEDQKAPVFHRDKTPELWESLPVSPVESISRGRALQYRNRVEDDEPDDPNDPKELPTPSVVLPIPSMDKLGIRYAGMERRR